MAPFNVLTATVTDIEELLNDGTLTSEVVVTEYLKQIDRCNGYLHAVLAVAPKELLIERARFLDHERAAGRVLGPLHGIPLLIKDNIATHPDLGMDTTAGTLALVGARVPESAPCVAQKVASSWGYYPCQGKLECKSALCRPVCLLMTNARKELSNFRGLHMPTGWSAVGGLTQSPYVIGGKRWDDGFGGHSAVGGSSSGSCAGVAAGFAPAALGTDTNGSILMPATRHDVYAMKPTLGLISQDGICPISFDFDSAGPIARSARDIAILMDVLVDRTQTTNISDRTYMSHLTGTFDGIRIGVLEPKEWHMPAVAVTPNTEVDEQQDADVAAAYERLKSLGAIVKPVKVASLDELVVDGMSQIQRVMDSRFRHAIESYLSKLEGSKVQTLDELMQFMRDNAKQEMPPESPNMTRLEMAAAFNITEDEYQDALADMRDFGRRRAVDKCLQDYDVDIILGPGDSRINELYATAGLPMAVVPLSYASFNGRPLGLCAVSTANQEGLLIEFMSAWQSHFNTERQLPTWIGGDPNGVAKNEL
ncbi:glutamyl-tRNA(gln) amidotransferase subunit A, putative [Cordyceps militaris CM01]|uniref:Glutamyl-tRNA(Gln) amidotransferase subunit A, putative n=1 Tax=Cordyceps militaris (strain CM01) TaxID=983644 RepID=G3JUK1_CORMM|nr:glutamyl-tRNA(gln) amidotransferase subunit A, putative [Cordyceps militaris CM01]EGX87737.1 glutamyl-tRNA(gln) amidotransferase subunit A, putative [Cordyceps militaris CM01]